MKIIEIPLNQIRPDVNQPRKSFNQDKIEEIAQTIKSVGIINPIEVDENYVIITGENRFKAAKIAGLKTVPCKILQLTPDKRYLRQVIENIQYANLTPHEIGLALKKLLTMLAADIDTRDTRHKGEFFSKGVNNLARKIGKDRNWIRLYLDLLEAPPKLQTAVEKGKVAVTHIHPLRKISQLNPEFGEIVQRKVISGEIKFRDGTRYIADALNRDPSKAKQVLSLDYSKFGTVQELGIAIAKIVPRLSDQLVQNFSPPEELNQIKNQLTAWLKRNDIAEVGDFHLVGIFLTLDTMREAMEKWQAKVPKQLDTNVQ